MKQPSKKIRGALFLLLAGSVICILLFSKKNGSFWDGIFFSGKNAYTLSSEYERSDTTYRALYASGGNLVRVEAYGNITSQQAQDYAQYKTMQLLGLYETARSPYPGVISDQITCENKYRPLYEKTTDPDTVIYHGYLNDRLQYGTCIDDQVVYKTTGIMKYCAGRKIWYYLEFISPKNNNTVPASSGMGIVCR